MLHPSLRWAAWLAASFALLGPVAAQSTGTQQPGATSAGSGDQSSGATRMPPALRDKAPESRHRGSMHEDRMPRHMRQGSTAASPSGTAATLPQDDNRMASDLSRDCAPTAAGTTTRPITQNPAFRSEMSQCTSESNRDERAECVRELWASSGGTAACM